MTSIADRQAGHIARPLPDGLGYGVVVAAPDWQRWSSDDEAPSHYLIACPDRHRAFHAWLALHAARHLYVLAQLGLLANIAVHLAYDRVPSVLVYASSGWVLALIACAMIASSFPSWIGYVSGYAPRYPPAPGQVVNGIEIAFDVRSAWNWSEALFLTACAVAAGWVAAHGEYFGAGLLACTVPFNMWWIARRGRG
jgi:hypothetical protein